MRNKLLFFLVAAGLIGALVSAIVYARPRKQIPPLYNPAPNPYAAGIYANGIIESYQASGQNVNIYPEVAGTVTEVFVAEGQTVERGQPLFAIDDSVQRALVEQNRSSAEAARALWEELEAQPRKESLAVAEAQVGQAEANLRTSRSQRQKQERSYRMDPRSISKDALDNAKNAERVARANLEVVRKQYELLRAGAWSFDIRNQRRQYEALRRAHTASEALLEKYTVRAPMDGVVMSIQTSVGSYVSSQGAYSTYTQGLGPAMTMSTSERLLAVRCFVDEILITRLPPPSQIQATMFIRGTNVSVPIQFVRVQPQVLPKIQLSNQRTERVDVRVLPVIFRFQPPKGVEVYPGQLVDVYVGSTTS